MSQVESRSNFLLIANHPALDWVNTELIAADGPADLIGTYGDVLRWLEVSGILAAAHGRAARHAGDRASRNVALAAAKKLRALARGIADGLARGRAVPGSVLEELNAALVLKRAHTELRRAAAVGRTAAARYERSAIVDLSDPRSLVGLLAELVADLLCAADVTRVRRCENPRCILFFLDTSRNGGRRWCSMSVCGNRAKSAAHYRRHRAAHRAGK